MAQIQNDQHVYALLGRLFEAAAADDEIGPRLQAVDAIVQQEFRRPNATVTMKLVAGEDRQVVTGATELRPEVVLVMDAATGHRVWLGELSAMTALSKGQIRARGPVAKILKLIDLVAVIAPRYRAQLEGMPAVTAGSAEEEGDETPAEEAQAEATPAEEPQAEESPAEEPAEEAPAEEAPADEPQAEAPAEDAPADEPQSEAPADEPQAEAPAESA